MAVVIRGIQQASITSGGPTQAFPTSGHPDFSASEPVKAGLFVGGAPTATGIASKLNSARMSVGITDGSRHRAVTIKTRNGVAISNTARGGFDDGRIFQLYGLGATSSNVGQLDFSSMSNDRITGSWSTFPSTAGLIDVVLFGGADLSAYVGSLTMPSSDGGTVTVDGTSDPNFGFQFDAVIFICANCAFDESSNDDAQISVGIAQYNGSSIENNCISWTTLDNQSTMVLVSSLRSNRCIYHHANPLSGSDGIEITARSSVGFTATKRGTGGSTPAVAFLALKFGTVQSSLFIRGTKTSTGIDSMTEPGFAPQFLLALSTLLQATDTNDVSSDAGSFGIGSSSTSGAQVTTDQGHAVCDEDAATTTNNGSIASASIIEVPLDDGSANGLLAAVDTFDPDGADLDYTTVSSPARGVIYLAVEREPVVAQAKGASDSLGEGAALAVVAGTVYTGQGAGAGDSQAKAQAVDDASGRAVAPTAPAASGASALDGSARAAAAGEAREVAAPTGDASGRAVGSALSKDQAPALGDESGSARATVVAQASGDAVVDAAARATSAGQVAGLAPAAGDAASVAAGAAGSPAVGGATLDGLATASAGGSAQAAGQGALDAAGTAHGASAAEGTSRPQVVATGVVLADAAGAGSSVSKAAAAGAAAGEASGSTQATAKGAGSIDAVAQAEGPGSASSQAPAIGDALGRAPGSSGAATSAPAVGDEAGVAAAQVDAQGAGAPLLEAAGVVFAEGVGGSSSAAKAQGAADLGGEAEGVSQPSAAAQGVVQAGGIVYAEGHGAGSSIGVAAGTLDAFARAVASAVATAKAQSSADLAARATGSSTWTGFGALPPDVVIGFYERTSKKVRLALRSAAGALSIQFPNLPFAQPVGTWARASVNFDEVREDVSHGAGRATYFVPGALLVDVFVPLLSGAGAALDLADSLAAMMQNKSDLDGVVYRMATVGQATDTGRDSYRVRFTLPFLAEDDFDRVAPVAFTGDDDFGGAEVEIRKRFRVSLPDVAVSYDNLPPSTSATWVRLIVNETDAYNVDGVRRMVGVVEARVHAPLNTGERDTLRLVDQIVEVFRLVDVGGVRFMVPSLADGSESAGQWVRSVFCPYYVDHA